MSIFIGFRISDELSEKLTNYCQENKLSKTETMTMSLTKLLAGNSNDLNNKVINEIFILAQESYLYISNNIAALNETERKNMINKISNIAHTELKKIKGGK